MANNTFLTQINDSPNLSSAQSPAPEGSRGRYNGYDALFIAYLFILDSVQIAEQTGQVQAKNLQINVNQQNSVINQEAQVNFAVMSYWMLHTKQTVWTRKVTDSLGFWHSVLVQTDKIVSKHINSTELQSMQAKNEAVAGIRNVLEDQLNALGQCNQSDSTNINTTVDQAQQSMQEDSGMMQMLSNLTNQISRV